MATSVKPFVLVCATPLYGHFIPIRNITKDLVERGYDVSMISATVRKPLVEEVGATFVQLKGAADFTEADIPRLWPERVSITPGLDLLLYDMEQIFIPAIKWQYEALQRALELFKAKDPSRPVVIVTDVLYFGALPLYLGAPGLRPAGTIGVGIIPLVLSSVDTFPFGPGLKPDLSPEGHEKSAQMTKMTHEVLMGKPQEFFQRELERLGAERSGHFLMDTSYVHPERFLQMCIPSMEYPRSDAPKGLRFAGGLPKPKGGVVFNNNPAWWDDVTVNTSKKKIIAVCQGTIAVNYNDLVIPTIQGLKDDPNVLVVAILGVKGATLPDTVEIPANARVGDYIPFDAILEHAHAFVTNGGYGGFQHAIGQGVPLVLAGLSEDKPEVAARAEWSGVGISLNTGNPTPEAVRDGVHRILNEPQYSARAKELELEMKRYDPFQVVADNVDELARV